MTVTGQLTRWDDDRGFGFLSPLDGGADVFLHISAFPRIAGRPQVGDLVNFAIERTDDGRRRAAHVEVVRTTGTAKRLQARPSHRRQARASRLVGLTVGLTAVAAFAAALVVENPLWIVPNGVALFYLAVSILCFVVYAVDKSAAVARRWRVSESALLGLGLIGGWPGAILAQQVLRHKIRKRRFMAVFVTTVVANVGVLVVLLSPLGSTIRSAVETALF